MLSDDSNPMAPAGPDHAESARDAWRDAMAELGVATVSLARRELHMDWSLTTPAPASGPAAQRVRSSISIWQRSAHLNGCGSLVLAAGQVTSYPCLLC